MSEQVSVTGPSDSSGPSTLVNALVGGIVSIVLVFLPFSPVLGGAVAGYLQGEDTTDGLRVGAFAGVVAVLPLLALVFLGFGFFAMVPIGMGGMPGAVGVLSIVAVLFAFGFALVYTVGLSALGGYLGAYLKGEMD